MKKLKTSFLQSHILLLHYFLFFSCLICMTLIYVMIRNLWLIMATHRTFLSCNSSYNIFSYVKCMKLDICFFQKKSRTENLKMLLQNNCINNGVNNRAWKTDLYGFRSLQVNYLEINQAKSKCQQIFWIKLAKKVLKQKKLNIIIEFYIFEIVQVANFSLKWKFLIFGPQIDQSKNIICDLNMEKWKVTIEF